MTNPLQLAKEGADPIVPIDRAALVKASDEQAERAADRAALDAAKRAEPVQRIYASVSGAETEANAATTEAKQAADRLASAAKVLGLALDASDPMAAGAALAIANPAITGWVAIAISGTSFVPQTIHVLRSDALRGVSLTMYLLLILTAVSWCTYGFLIHDFIVSAPNFIIIPCGVVVLVKAWSVRHAAV